MTEMTEAKLRELCKKHDLFLTPGANEKLYAHYCGFRAIGGMDKYTGLKTLFLEGNGLDSLAGLPHMPHLKCLYAHANGMYNLEGLESAPALDTLNVDQNFLETLEGLEATPGLGTLLAADNRFETAEDVAPLRGCLRLTTLDLRNNKFASEEGLVQLLQALPALRCLYLRGNEFVSKMRNYRKSLIAALPELTYLDDRPIFEVERRAALAWQRGGVEEERAERLQVQQQEQTALRGNFDEMQTMRRECWRKRRASLGLAPGDTDPFFEMNKAPRSNGDTPGQAAEEHADADVLPCRKCTNEVCRCKQLAEEDGEEQPPLQPRLPPQEEAKFQEMLQADPVHQANEQESAVQLAKIMEQDQWTNIQPAQQLAPRDTGLPAELSAARSAATKRKLHLDVCPDEDRDGDTEASEQPEAPSTPPAQLQQQPVAAAAHSNAREASQVAAGPKVIGQEASPSTAAAATETSPPGAPAPAADKPAEAAVSDAASEETPDESPPPRRVTFAPERTPDETAADSAVASAPHAPITIATAKANTAARPPAKHAPGILKAAVGAKMSADAEELLPEPKAPTGRLQPASKWQDNDAFEAQGANVEEVEDITAGTDEEADAEGQASADAAPASAKLSTMSEERRRNLLESQQLLDDLGAASAAMRATWSGFM